MMDAAPTSLTDVAPLSSVASAAFATISSRSANSTRVVHLLVVRRPLSCVDGATIEPRRGRKRSHSHRPIGGLGSQRRREYSGQVAGIGRPGVLVAVIEGEFRHAFGIPEQSVSTQQSQGSIGIDRRG